MSNFFDDFTKPLPLAQRLTEVVAFALTILNVITFWRRLDGTEQWVMMGVSALGFILITLYAYKPQWNSKTTNHNEQQLIIDEWTYRIVSLEIQALLFTSVQFHDCGNAKLGVPFYIVVGLLIATAIVHEVLIVKNRTRND